MLAFGYICSESFDRLRPFATLPMRCCTASEPGCGWLSQPQTTMAAPTPVSNLRGLLAFAFRHGPPTFMKTDSAK